MIQNGRGLDPATMIVRISDDGGDGAYKVIANLFDPNSLDQNRGEMMTGSSFF